MKDIIKVKYDGEPIIVKPHDPMDNTLVSWFSKK